MTKIPHDAVVFIGDGRKALFLRNAGDAKFLNLVVERVVVNDNPPAHEQGTDQPGRAFSPAGNRRSSIETTDWHDLEEHRFAHRSAALLEGLVREGNVKALIVVAPPRTLADLRAALHSDVKARLVAEIDKDLTKHSIAEIERHLGHDLEGKRHSAR